MTTAEPHSPVRAALDRARTGTWTSRVTLVAAAAAGAAVGATLWGHPTRDLAQLLVLLPAVYITTTASGQARQAWLFLSVLSAAFFLAPMLSIEPGIGVGGVALVLVLAVVGLSSLRDPRQLTIQGGGAVLFIALALVSSLALDSATSTGLLLVAAWTGHAIWDALHLRSPHVVPCSYAAWCGTLDLVVAAGLLLHLAT